MRTRNKVIAGVLAGIVTTSVGFVTAMQLSHPAAAEYVVDFSQGEYSVWDGVTYTFDWYESPETIDGVTVYTLRSASDLAGLSVITNDLSDSDWNVITNNVSAEDADYIAMVDCFEGDVIKLDCHIDLLGYDWLPIAYPWNTPNLTAEYEFINTNGSTVRYNGVDHIPDDTVDVWVNGENGESISTRYWEFPESELRFRDYVYTLNFDSTHMTTSTVSYDDFPAVFGFTPKLANGSQQILTLGNKRFDVEEYQYAYKSVDGYDVAAMYPYSLKNIDGYTEHYGFLGTFEGNNKNIKGLHPSTPWTTDAAERLNTYDPLGKGLFSLLGKTETHEGVIRNLNVSGAYENDIVSYSALLCAYNYGTIDACYVDCNMRQSLIEMLYPVNKEYAADGLSDYALSTSSGTVMPLGNSGLLSSQNYGVIKNCYTVGDVTLAFRQFGAIVSSNYGLIENCENRANISSEYVETDFITDEWCYEVYLSVDERLPRKFGYGSTWRQSADLYVNNLYMGFAGGEGYIESEADYEYVHTWSGGASSNYNNLISTPALRSNAFFASMSDEDVYTYSWFIHNDLYNPNVIGLLPKLTVEHYVGASAVAAATGRSNGDCEFEDWDDYLWIADVYRPEDNESLAANRLYGVYTMTLAGGITAVNHGDVQNCVNKGDVTSLFGTSPRNNFSVYDRITNGETPKDYYSYIRPTNAYGIFATAREAYSLAGGIVAVNLKNVSDCENLGSIQERQLSDAEAYASQLALSAEYRTFDDMVYNEAMDIPNVDKDSIAWNPLRTAIDFIVASPNDFYQQNAKISPNNDDIFTAYSMDWWVTTQDDVDNIASKYAEYESTYAVELVNDEDYVLNRNMPYPFVRTTNCSIRQRVGGIAAVNIDTLQGNVNKGSAPNGICDLSVGVNDDNAKLSRNKIDSAGTTVSTIFNVAYNTDIDMNSAVKTNHDLYAIGNVVLVENNTVELAANTTYDGKGMFGNVYSVDDSRISVIDNAIYDTVCHGDGIAVAMEDCDVFNVLNVQDSENGVASLTNCTLDSIYAYGDNTNGIGSGTITTANNLFYGGLVCDWALGNFSAVADDSVFEINNLYIYSFANDAITRGRMNNGVGSFENCNATNWRIFMDFDKHMWDAVNSNFSDIIVYGDSNVFDDFDGYVFNFDTCVCKDMLLETNVNFEWVNYTDTYTLKHIPGMLKLVADTNTFENCVIQVPDGAVSFTALNAGFVSDDTIASDVIMSWDEDARRSGALAWHMDKSADGRTYDYTVAFNDGVFALPSDLYFVEYDMLPSHLKNEVTLPAYTRKIIDDSEQPYYAVDIPMNGYGAGYVQGYVTNGDIEYITTPDDAVFTKTTIYATKNTPVSLKATVYDGYDLIGLQRLTRDVSAENISVDTSNDVVYTEIVTEDVTLQGVWSDVYRVEVDSDNDWCSIVPNCTGAAYTQTVRVQLQCLSDELNISRVYYSPYKKDVNNLDVLDRTVQVDIPLETLEFVMPKTHVCLFVEGQSTNNAIQEFVLAGESGTIDDTRGIITVVLNDSVDVCGIAPDRVVCSEGSSLSPSVDELQDFTQPVIYTVTSESGDTRRYTVNVVTLQDGVISEFSILQYEGVINGDEIIVTIPDSIDITNCVPTIVWSGLSITPDASEYQDFTEDVVYTVESSLNEIRSYVVKVNRITSDVPTGLISLVDENGTSLQVDIDYELSRITVSYPYGMNVSSIKIMNLGFDGMTNLLSGDVLNLTKYNCLIVSQNGETHAFDIVGKMIESSEKIIKQFTLYGYDGVIDNANFTITVTIPSKYDITNIAPDAIGFVGKSITDVGIAKDFTNTVIYTVTANDGTTVDYAVNVIRSDV